MQCRVIAASAGLLVLGVEPFDAGVELDCLVSVDPPIAAAGIAARAELGDTPNRKTTHSQTDPLPSIYTSIDSGLRLPDFAGMLAR